MFPRTKAIVLLMALVLAVAPETVATGIFTPYGEVRQVLFALSEILPVPLQRGDTREQAWPAWIADHDREIRARLQRGDEDTIVNWLRLGTSFTSRPRAIRANGDEGTRGAAVPDAGMPRLIAERAHDLVTALVTPGQDERRLFARTLLEKKEFRVDVPAERARLEAHLIAEADRVADEQAAYARETDAVRRLPDVTEQFARRSRLFRERGLSLDTSIVPGFAIERTLREMAAKGLLAAGSVKRVAVIGPGLDFADKAAGYDFYPQQTLQPFAIIDTLRGLGLAKAGGVGVTTLDISPRVNDHLTRARARAARGSSYVIQLPLDRAIRWSPGLVDYWKRLGSRIGTGSPVASGVPGPPKPRGEGGSRISRTQPAPQIDVRTVRVGPDVVRQVTPADLDIVAERLDGESFDLIIATNIFVYYDTLDQSLALANVEAMLRRGGFLLSNNALLELPVSRMRSGGYLTTEYSDRPDDGDHIVWYQRQ